jgi:2-polyprenyl-6-methoxyphenol hydroxylase-like FAD-dependent oxidoreductase
VTSEYDVIIIGGGIGGLTTALALKRLGLRFVVLEKSQGLSEVGAGLWLAPNPLQVLQTLGIVDQVTALGYPLKRVEVISNRGTVLQQVCLADYQSEFGFSTIAIHRIRLQRCLYEQLEPESVRFNCLIREIVQGDERVQVRLESGETPTCRVLVGADGLHSQVRQSTLGPSGMRFSGTSSYRGIAPLERPGFDKAKGVEIWGRGCRFGCSHIAPREIYWYLTFDAAHGQRRSPEEILSHARTLVAQEFEEYLDVVSNTPPRQIIHTDISDLKTLRTWKSGRVVLLGDAAHATTPNLGQGAAQAIEDALALANCLQSHGLNENALDQFVRLRTKKTQWIVDRSWSIGRICHLRNPIAVATRDFVLRWFPKSLERRMLRTIFTPDIQ